MTNKLQQYFPMIPTRDEVLHKIYSSPHLKSIYEQWSTEQRKEFLDFTTGARGVKILYDCFCKEILNPETVPERLEDFLSLLLRRKVKIIRPLPNDNSRIADESSLMIMDMLVELDDGTVTNIEIQKLGYAFPGQRCACYSADLLLRQYKRVRGRKKRAKKFNYKDIKPVYTIVIYEKSTAVFHKYPHAYVHSFEQHSDTGLQLDLLQKYIFLPLDIFKENLQNNSIRNRLDAWLTFLAIDDPEWIFQVIKKYPDFKDLYVHVYDICRNIEGVMEMFSKELRILDRNTVQYMIDEMQEQLDKKNRIISRKNRQLSQRENQLSQKDRQLSETNRLYQKALQRIAELEKGKNA